MERGYLDSIGDLLAERTSLQFDIPDGLNSYETYQKFPHLVSLVEVYYVIWNFGIIRYYLYLEILYRWIS